MKFKRLNDDKLQIIISKDDLVEHDLKKWDFVPYNPVAQKLFQEILEEAYNQCGFEVGHDAQLMIEAYPMTGDSMIIIVTKVSESGKGLLELGLEVIEEQLFEEFVEEEFDYDAEEIVCSFGDLENAIQLAQIIKPYYGAKSIFFKFKLKYYLALKDMSALDEKSYSILTEYGDIESVSLAFLEEHAQVVMANDAIEILAGL